MLNLPDMLTGKRVYRMASHAPNRGTVKPKGYIKREIKKQGLRRGVSKTGGDGMSDTRSGLAASALRRGMNKATLNKRFAAKGKVPVKAPVARTAAAVSPAAQAAARTALGVSKPVASAAVAAAPTGPPQVSINPDGTLKLPFNYEFSQNALEKSEEANNALLDLQRQFQQQGLEFTSNMRNAKQGYTTQKRQALNAAAGGGSAFSSAYGNQVVNDATDYNNQVNDLQSRNNVFNTGITNQQNAVVAGLNNFLRKSAGAYGAELDSQAGTLGYGKSTKAAQPVAKPKPKPKPRPKGRKKKRR